MLGEFHLHTLKGYYESPSLFDTTGTVVLREGPFFAWRPATGHDFERNTLTVRRE